MTPVFAVGEIAIGCNMQYDLVYNGMECEIVEVVRTVSALHAIGWQVVDGYYVRWQDGMEGYCQAANLRKKRPPESDDATARQAMLDCIERAKMGQGATV